MKVAIVGGGISGLSAAYRLHTLKPDWDIALVEAGPRLGGVISTRMYEGAVVEEGPDSLITLKPYAIDLAKEIGLADNIISINDMHRRAFLAYKGKLHGIPQGFNLLAPSALGPVFNSPIFSTAGKLRMALDLVLPARRSSGDESLASFVTRRFGKEALERVAQPLAGGIYTADPNTLSMKSTMPRFLELEQQYGSVIRGLKQSLKAKSSPGSGEASGARYGVFVSLDRGLQLLIDTLVQKLLAIDLKLNCPLRSIEKTASGQWRLALASNESLVADAVIFALPAGPLASLLRAHDRDLAAMIDSITAASSAVLNFMYKKEDVKHPLDGFGFVVPAIERRSIIACSFSSVKYAGRAPNDLVSLRVFMGGAMNPKIYELDDAAMVMAAKKDIAAYLGIKKNEIWSCVKRWPQSMPQYAVGHCELVEKIEERIGQMPGIYVCGNAFKGVGIPDCISSGNDAARRLLAASERPLPVDP
jgi:oxygen-dependent protoporphyrinogen oxidase